MKSAIITQRQGLHPRHPAWITPAAVALLLGITVVIYLPAASHRLLDWDDTTYVTGNPKMADWRAIWSGWSSGYMPVTETFWWLIGRGHGVRPGPYHVLNIGLHLLNVLLVYVLLRRWPGRRLGRGAGGIREAAPILLGAALFAWHPVQVEAVCWVTSLKDLASALFCLLALNAYILFLASPDGSTVRRWSWYWAGAAAFGLAMLAKPTVVAMPVAAAAVGRWGYDRGWARAARDMLPWMLAAAFPLAVNAVSQAGLYQGFEAPWFWRLPVALDALGFYCGKIIWPLELLPAYGRSPRWLIGSGVAWWSWIPAAGLLALAAWRRRQWPGLWLGTCFLASATLPVLGLWQFAAQDNSTVYDHYLYLGMVGPAIAMAWLLGRRPVRGWTLAVVTAGLLVLAAKSAVQTEIWRDDRALWTYTLRKHPDSEVALVSMGKLAAAQGDDAGGRVYYEQALRVAPWSVEAHNNLGACLARAGQLDPAREHFEAALKLNPRLITAHDNMAEYWLVQGNWERAEPHVRQVLQHQAAHVGANAKMAEHLLRTKQAAACIRLLEPVVRPVPSHANLYNLLGVAYGEDGQSAKALAVFQAALRLDPRHAGAARNLAQAQQQEQRGRRCE